MTRKYDFREAPFLSLCIQSYIQHIFLFIIITSMKSLIWTNFLNWMANYSLNNWWLKESQKYKIPALKNIPHSKLHLANHCTIIKQRTSSLIKAYFSLRFLYWKQLFWQFYKWRWNSYTQFLDDLVCHYFLVSGVWHRKRVCQTNYR